MRDDHQARQKRYLWYNNQWKISVQYLNMYFVIQPLWFISIADDKDRTSKLYHVHTKVAKVTRTRDLLIRTNFELLRRWTNFSLNKSQHDTNKWTESLTLVFYYEMSRRARRYINKTELTCLRPLDWTRQSSHSHLVIRVRELFFEKLY